MSSRNGSTAEASGARRLQRPPGDVQRLMEVVGRRLGRPLRPQQLGRPLPVDSTLRRQREQLHQALGLTQPPRALGHHLSADANREGAEQPDLHGLVHFGPNLIWPEDCRRLTKGSTGGSLRYE